MNNNLIFYCSCQLIRVIVQSTWDISILPFNLPDTKDVIALNGGAVTDQKHSTFFFRKKDVSGLLS